MTQIAFTSNLSSHYATDLEELLFFHPRQDNVRAHVMEINERYGAPRIDVANDRVFVVLDSSRRPQTLYVLEVSDGQQSLIGVMVYLRENATLSLLHVAVREDWTGMRSDGRPALLLTMVERLRDIARRIKGIRSLTVFPGTAGEHRLSVQGRNRM